MTDFDDRIRAAVAELVATAPAAPPLPDLATAPPWPGRHRNLVLAVAVAAVVLMAAGLAFGLRDPHKTVVTASVSTTAPQPDKATTTTLGPTTVVRPHLDPADSQTPAAGTCAEDSGPTGTVSIRADFVPSPRCLVMADSQELRVTNLTGQTITPTLGSRSATIPDGQSYTFPGPVGSYLAPGVHDLRFSPASAAGIWVGAVCRGPGASDCHTP